MSARRLTKPSSICSWRVIRKKRLRRLLAYHRKQQATELQTLAILATLQNPLKLSPITKIQTFKYRFTTSGLNRSHVLEVRAKGRGTGVALVAPPNHPDSRALVVNGHVTISLVVLAELDQAADGSAGLAAFRLGQFDSEVVVVFILLEADNIELQGMQQRAGCHCSAACLSAFRMPSLTLPLPSLAAMARLSASR